MSNALKLMTLFILLSIAVYFVTYLLEGGFTVIYSITQLIAYLFPAILLSVFWNKTPSFYDHFSIYHESRILLISGSIYGILYLLVAISPFLGASDYTRAVLGDVFGAAVASFMGCYQVWYPCILLKRQHHELTRELSLAKYINVRYAQSRTLSNVSPATPTVVSRSGTEDYDGFDRIDTMSYQPTNIDLILMHVIDESVKLDAYFDHIIKEFSIELGLAYIELAQFKHEVSQRLFDEEERGKLEMRKKIMCVLNNEEIPRSHIVYGDIEEVRKENSENGEIFNEIDAFKYRASLLCAKYIRCSTYTELEINICDSERQRLTWLLSSRENWQELDREELFCLFDSVLKELW
eukprot:CAMPEP_0197030518 /NCGR_PEP_ID=MMETSP1384-20130603/9746_1 /TAXON_ID=29189 /ORGANISM="Ammonia sp." /LENGTH=350 /DNA_ID=CAMNT_0042459895 /DNA_START=482 /DNA_END=1531 /DNA_ORIENTATION=+